MKAQRITDVHEDIVKVLLAGLRRNSKQAIITYTDLCNRIGNQVNCRNVASYLGDISCWCDEIGAPMLSVLVINKHDNRPGQGFFKLYAELHDMSMKSLDEELIFVSEFQKVSRYRDWKKLEAHLGI